MYVQNMSSKSYSDVCCYYIFNVYPISVQPMSLLSANIQSILLFYSSLSVDSFTFSVFFLNNKSTILKCSGLFSQGESERKGSQYADEQLLGYVFLEKPQQNQTKTMTTTKIQTNQPPQFWLQQGFFCSINEKFSLMHYFLLMPHSKSQEFSQPSFYEQTLLCVKIFLLVLQFLCVHFICILHLKKQLKHFLTSSLARIFLQLFLHCCSLMILNNLMKYIFSAVIEDHRYFSSSVYLLMNK